MSETVNWGDKVKAMMADPDSKINRFFDAVDKQLEYLDNPLISAHDKDLQYALDLEMSDPAESEEFYREALASLDYSDPTACHGQWEFHGFGSGSDEEIRAELERLLSPESIAESRVEYAEHQALVVEAISKGFVKGGNCKNLRRPS